MLLMAADSTVVRIAFAEPVVSPAAAANNNTPPLPPPPPQPPDNQTQRPVEPGTVIQGWDNSSFAPTQIADHRDVAMQDSGNETSYETTYGNFVLNRSSPYFVRFSSPGPDQQEIAESAFLVLYQGLTLLSPGNGTVDNATSEELAFHYGLYLSAVLLGTMTVKYRFLRDTNNITISFSPSVGLPSQYQIVWLTFTSWDAIDTAYPSDVEQRFEDLDGAYGSLFLGAGVGTLYGTGTIEMPGAIIRPYKVVGSPGGMAIRMDVSDAAGDFNASFGGSNFSFLGFSGNAVATTFAAGHLTIDPQLVATGVPATATAYSGVQRKTFYDGQRYWLFWQSSTTVASYATSVDGKSWIPSGGRTAVTVTTSFQYGFTVINYGKTVVVLWTDSADSTQIHMRSGLIAEDTIYWDDSSPTGRQLLHDCFPVCHNYDGPLSAAFTSQGMEFGVSFHDDGGSVGYFSWLCSGTSGFSICAIATPEFGQPDYVSGIASVVAGLADGSNHIARVHVYVNGGGFHILHVRIYSADGLVCDNDIPETEQPVANWYNYGRLTAIASGNQVIVAHYSEFANTGIRVDKIDAGCNVALDGGLGVGDVSIRDLTAGTSPDGNVYLFYARGGLAYFARIVPGSATFTTSQILSGYQPLYLSAASFASHYVPLAFVINNNTLYYSNYPLPLDGEASVNNPWASKLGSPFVTDTGGTISPTTGLVASGQTLIRGTPAISIIYREPGLLTLAGEKYAMADTFYQIIPGIYYDLPWINGTGAGSYGSGVLHMTGGQKYVLSLTGQSGLMSWYNITSGIRYTLRRYYDPANPTASSNQWTLTLSSGAYMVFDARLGNNNGNLTKVYSDTTGQNYLTYATTPGSGTSFTGIVIDSSTPSRTISFSDAGITSYGNGQSITFTRVLGAWTASDGLSCSAANGANTGNSGTLTVTDAIGRGTKYWVCKWRLMRLESPNGGRVDYWYSTASQSTDATLVTYVSQGTDAYSAPITKVDIYNESGANVKARSLAFNWNFQNGEVVRALVNTTDKSAVAQGSNEYIFNSAAGTASVRVYDSAGQVLYYDMETCTASPCGTNPMKDLSGNLNSGTFGGSGGSFPYGKYGKAGGYGGGAWIQAADSNSLDATSGVTLSAWISPSSIVGIHRIISKWGASGGISSYLLSMGDSGTNGKIRFAVRSGGSNIIADSATIVSTSNWWHVAGTYDGKTATVYVNGASSGASSQSGSGNSIQVTATPLRIGDEGDGSGTYKFSGVIDEVRIFNRALSPEDIGILYTKNALKKGEQQNWYSINGQPHLSEGFVGDETTASVVTQDAIDDWGNQIYHRDALGNGTFASYANTNHQNHFYAPGRLTKTGTSNTEFIDFSNGLFPTGQGTWTVTSTATTPTQIDYGTFDKVSPSLKINAPSSGYTTIVHPISSGLRFIEFRARIDAKGSGQSLEIRLGTSVFDGYLAARFGTSGNIEFYNWANAPNGWMTCNYANGLTPSYSTQTWYRFTFEINLDGSFYPWKAYVNGIDMSCGVTQMGYLPTKITVEAGTGANTWVDDIKLYSNSNGQTGYYALQIGFSGLQPRQSIRLLAENGLVIDQTMQTGTGTLWMSFNSAPTGAYNYYENGDNAKAAIQIYAEDGTLEYQSPLTRFFVGEQYTYTRPRTFADELVKTRNGALYWPAGSTGIYADEFGDCDNHVNGITCFPSSNWNGLCTQGSQGLGCWRQADGQDSLTKGAIRGNYVHVTPFDYGSRTHWFRTSGHSNPNYFVTYVRIPSGRAPDGIALLFGEKLDINGACSDGIGLRCWHQAFWGSVDSREPETGLDVLTNTNMGPLPTSRDQWIQLVVSIGDSGLQNWPSGWRDIGYKVSGGEAEWDVTTTQTDASFTVSGLTGLGSNLKVSLYNPLTNTVMASAVVSSGSATINLYRTLPPLYTAIFPTQAMIKICSSTPSNVCDGSSETDEYYFGPLRDIWAGDTFRYIGASSFFDSKSSGTPYWPSSSIHTALLGSKKFSGDCLGAVACYDMETLSESSTAPDSGTVSSVVIDLSGKGSHGAIGNLPQLSAVDKAAAGLGMTFNPATVDTVQATIPTLNLAAGGWNSVSLWMYWTGGTSQMPFGFTTYDLWFAGSSFGFNTGTGDVWGIADTGLANTRTHVVAEFYNGDVKAFNKLYINGVQKTLSQKVGTTGSRSVTTYFAELSGWPNDATNKFGGTLDQVQVFNRALTDTEVLEQYYSRMPGAPQTYLRPQTNGLPVTSRVPYEGTYLYVAATYDSKGNVLSVTDAGRTISGGANITRYAYSTLYGRDYRTQVNRSDGKQIYAAYDFQSGVKYGTLDIDCRRSRTQYDAIGRPIQTSIYDTDSSEKLHLDMETATYNSLKDVSCAGNQDASSGQTVTMTGTNYASGIDGAARSFNGASEYLYAAPTSTVSGSFTVDVWVKPSSAATGTTYSFFSTRTPGYDYSFDAKLMNGNKIHADIGTGTAWITTTADASFTYSANAWYNIAYVVTTTGYTIYVNGTQVGSGSYSSTPLLWDTNHHVYIGQVGYVGAEWFSGSIDEVRLFNVVRSTPEIVNLWSFKYNLLTSSAAAYDDVFPTSVTTYDGVSTPRALYFDMDESYQAANGYWYMEDKSGHGQDGQLTGTLSLVAGKIGNARQFSTSSDKIRIASPTGLPLASSPRTLSAWIKPTSVSSEQMVASYGPSSSSGDSFALGYDGTGKLFVDIYNGRATSTTLIVGIGQFHFVAATYSGGSQVTLYLDGATQTVSFSGTATTPKTAFGNFIIGQWVTNNNYDTFQGTIDEVHLVSRDLSATEVSNIYNNAEKSHMSRTYQDGLGRSTRSVIMDMFGSKLTTVATLGWNDKPVYSYLPSGQYSTFAYDFLGRTIMAQSPGDSTISGISRTIVSEKARMVESVDAVGRKAYGKTDLLGRTVETAVWNPATGAYGNLTNASYNALSEVTVSKDAKGQITTMYYNSLGKPKMTVFPDSTDAAMRYSLIYYDDNLRAFQTVDVMGRVAVSTYDSIGRVTSVKLKPSVSTDCTGTPNPCVVTYYYDPIHDDLLTIDNTTAKITRTYDSLHRLKQDFLDVPTSPPAFSGVVTYTYDNAGKVTNMQYPVSSQAVVYVYDSLGRVREVDYGANKYAELAYDAYGRLGSIYYWKGTNTTLQEKYTYDARDRVTQVKVFDTGSTYMQLDYVYNKASEIRWSTDNMYVLDGGGVGSNPKNVTYAYNGNGRLTYASGPWGASQVPETHAYTYDQVGNLLTWKLGGTTYNYGVSGWNRLDTFDYNTMSFAYNSAGSMTCKTESNPTATRTRYTQDFLQQLTKVEVGVPSACATGSGTSTYTYSYDGLGRRVKTYDGTTTSYFMYAGSKMLYSMVGAAETDYVYVGDKLLFRWDLAVAQPRYYHQDISPGNVRLITYYNAGIIVDAKYRYRPFGDMVTPPLVGSTQRFQYAQQEYDGSTTRQYHMGLRYQDPVVGRFVQRDPIGPGYSYAGNNPVSLSDRTGMYTQVGTPWQNFMNWLGSEQGREIVTAINTILIVATLASFIPTGGGSAALYMVVAGLIGGTIAVAVTYAVTGGHASANDYYLAFTIGFAVGAVIGGYYFGVRAAELAAAKATFSGAEKACLSGTARSAVLQIRYGTSLNSIRESLVLRAPSEAELAELAASRGAGSALESSSGFRLTSGVRLVQNGDRIVATERLTTATLERAELKLSTYLDDITELTARGDLGAIATVEGKVNTLYYWVQDARMVLREGLQPTDWFVIWLGG